MFVCVLAGYEIEKRAAMQSNRYCPGVIQPFYNRCVQQVKQVKQVLFIEYLVEAHARFYMIGSIRL